MNPKHCFYYIKIFFSCVLYFKIDDIKAIFHFRRHVRTEKGNARLTRRDALLSVEDTRKRLSVRTIKHNNNNNSNIIKSVTIPRFR